MSRGRMASPRRWIGWRTDYGTEFPVTRQQPKGRRSQQRARFYQQRATTVAVAEWLPDIDPEDLDLEPGANAPPEPDDLEYPQVTPPAPQPVVANAPPDPDDLDLDATGLWDCGSDGVDAA